VRSIVQLKYSVKPDGRLYLDKANGAREFGVCVGGRTFAHGSRTWLRTRLPVILSHRSPWSRRLSKGRMLCRWDTISALLIVKQDRLCLGHRSAVGVFNPLWASLLKGRRPLSAVPGPSSPIGID
jgi:hypothetical protein